MVHLHKFILVCLAARQIGHRTDNKPIRYQISLFAVMEQCNNEDKATYVYAYSNGISQRVEQYLHL